MLSKNERNYLLKHIPQIKLFYEDILHKKVQSNYYVLIPKGIPCYIWFTQLNNKDIAVLLKTGRDGNIYDVKPLYISFHKSLSINTLISGTILNYKGIDVFSVKDIIWFKNKQYEEVETKCKLYLYTKLFQHIKNTQISSIQINLPVITNNYNIIYDIINTLPYQIKHIERYRNKYIGNLKVRNPINANFIVRATTQHDIYNLYCLKNNTDEEFYDIAFIPSYKKSVEMNNIFRNIRENINLDFLEESDDEELFQNINEDKFLKNDVVKHMECIYIEKYKKWLPQNVLRHDISNIISLHKLKRVPLY